MCRQDKMRYFLQLVQKLLLLEYCCLDLLLVTQVHRRVMFLHKSKRFHCIRSNKQKRNQKYLDLQNSRLNHHLYNILRVFHQLYRKLFFYQNRMINRLKIKLYHLILRKRLLLQNLLLHHQLLF